jgi:thymidylate synthase
MNSIEKQYLELVNHILRFGYTKQDRTGTGTKSIFGWQIRHSMKEGFPLLTTKKMAWKTMVIELLWFLRGDTNIKYLVDNGCHIWDGDAYKRYCKNADEGTFSRKWLKLKEYFDGFFTNQEYSLYTQEEFINKIKTDDEFAKKWGHLGPIYGRQWRSWNVLKWTKTDIPDPVMKHDFIYRWNIEGVDQIANAIHLLKTDPDSRRILVNSWNTGEIHEMVLPPCHYSFQFYTRELSIIERINIHVERCMASGIGLSGCGLPDGMDYEFYEKVFAKYNVPKRAISLLWNQRSVDVGLGLPFNIASYALLLEIIAKEVNMIPEEVIGNLGDCHIYLNHEEGLKEQLTRIPYELPKLDKLTDYLCIKDDWECYKPNDFKILNYQSHPAIKLPLSN